ncbi:MAG: aminotransferase class I/II-fold pyridoxal phosphate-dependent enzyme, partial [Pseudomonadota bacterium]
MTTLSLRGRKLIDSPPMPEYIVEHFNRIGDPWHPVSNAQGYIGLCVAENKLDNHALAKQLATYEAPARTLNYDAMNGNYEFRQRLSEFMGRTFLKREFEPEQLIVLAGAGAILECLFYAICDPGDGVLIPTPSYAGFWPDIETRDELTVVPVHCSSVDQFKLTPALLDAALDTADVPIRALLFTTPNNPLGQVYAREEVMEIVEWSQARGLHLVVDEIYALSVFGKREFVSVATLSPALGDNIHITWAFSKDFGASGLRCGVMVSENQDILNAVNALAYWCASSGHTQYLLSQLLGDSMTVDNYLTNMRNHLRQAYQCATDALSNANIPYYPADAAFFLVCDLREYL